MKLSEYKSYDDLSLFLSSPQAAGLAHSAAAPLPTKPAGGFAGAPFNFPSIENWQSAGRAQREICGVGGAAYEGR